MTPQELVAYPKATISPKMAGAVTGQDPYWFNVAARAGKLPFAHYFSGRNLRISKADILAFCGYNIDGTMIVQKGK